MVIGPKSVRLYPSDRKGWKAGTIIKQPDGVTLPVLSGMNVLLPDSVIYGDRSAAPGRINMDGVYYWPNKGNGYFGHPVHIPGFIPESILTLQIFIWQILMVTVRQILSMRILITSIFILIRAGIVFQSRLNYRYPKASAMIIPVNCNLRIFREMVWIV